MVVLVRRPGGVALGAVRRPRVATAVRPIAVGFCLFLSLEHVGRVLCDSYKENPAGHNSNMTVRTNTEGDNSLRESRTLDGSSMLTLSRLFAQSCGSSRVEVSGAGSYLLSSPGVVDTVVWYAGASVHRIGSSELLEFGGRRPFLLGCIRVHGAAALLKKKQTK